MKRYLVLAYIALAALAVAISGSVNAEDTATGRSAASPPTVPHAEAGAAAVREGAGDGSRAGVGSIVGEARATRRLSKETAARAAESRRATPLQTVPVKRSELDKPRFAPTVPPTAEGPAPAKVGGTAAARIAGAFTIFRNTVAGTSNARVVEPTAANDRNGVLVTGNTIPGKG
jgi:hypothetical protein